VSEHVEDCICDLCKICRANDRIFQLERQIEHLKGALRMIAEGTICPELFPADIDEHVIAAKTAMTIATVALEQKDNQ